MEKGEEKLTRYINASHIFKVLTEHHNILKDLNTTNKPLSDKVYDNVINVSSDGEEKPEPVSYKTVAEVSANDITSASVIEMESSRRRLQSYRETPREVLPGTKYP